RRLSTQEMKTKNISKPRIEFLSYGKATHWGEFLFLYYFVFKAGSKSLNRQRKIVSPNPPPVGSFSNADSYDYSKPEPNRQLKCTYAKSPLLSSKGTGAQQENME
ncbi:hypothetical protein LJC27_04530, partial [Christensenellaceae bacterium OttesenSCG-928-M15]|nr:hypothetical protein [Christensenellaceae bacterium OttesenSCG-928-M15]